MRRVRLWAGKLVAVVKQIPHPEQREGPTQPISGVRHRFRLMRPRSLTAFGMKRSLAQLSLPGCPAARQPTYSPTHSPAGKPSFTRESAAATLLTSPSGVNGFWIKTPSKSAAPCRRISSIE
jgi:hypothetical protein